MISSTSTKNISPRGTHRMTAPSVAAAITVTASRTPSTSDRRVRRRIGHGHRDRDDQADAGHDLRLHAPLRGFAMAVEHRQPAERGIDGEIEAADGIERQQGQTDSQGHAYGALDIVAIYIGKQAAHPRIVLERSKDGLTMPYQDLRAFLTTLKGSQASSSTSRGPSPSNTTSPRPSPRPAPSEGPALMFTQTGTDFPLVGGRLRQPQTRADRLRGDRRRPIHAKVLKGINNQIAPVDFKGAAPCQEVVLTGDAIDVTKLPVPIYSPKDGGPYITAGIVVSENPETGIPDIGNYRFQIHGPKEMGPWAAPSHRFGKNIAQATEMGKQLHGAVVIGVDPLTMFSCQVQSSDATNDWFVAGGLRGSPVELVKAVSNDLKVPATPRS